MIRSGFHPLSRRPTACRSRPLHHAARALALGLAALGGALLGDAPAAAQGAPGAGPWHDTEHGSVRLIAASAGVGERERLKLGLEFRMAEGWKIYWRSPGDAGFPPRPDWHGAENVADVTMAWPTPTRFSVLGMQTIGYKDGVVFPLTVSPERAGEPVTLAGTVSYLTCADVCVPYDATLSITLPAGPPDGTPQAHVIDRFRAAVPVDQDGTGRPAVAGLAVESARVLDAAAQAGAGAGATTAAGPEGGGASAGHGIDPTLSLAVTASSAAAFGDERLDLLVEGPEASWFGVPTVSLGPERRTATFRIPGGGVAPSALSERPLTLTLIAGERAVEARIAPETGAPESAESLVSGALGSVPAAGAPTAGPEGPALALWAVLGLAVLGGLILNLMPCVLPVLSLKLLSLVSKSGAERRTVRTGFLVASAGILVSFMALAAGAIGLKLAGHSIGWGIQFQQPVFLSFMVALLILFTCNMLGLFEFRLPGFLGERAAAAGGAQGHLGDFLTGAFATLLATPCSAPFLGTAVGFALGRGPAEIAAVFAALGLGMALPYLAVAAFPRCVALLPKPGPWMLWVKRVLALALLGTALWLLTVLRVTIGTEGAVAVGLMAGLAGIVLGAKKVQGARLARFAWPLSAMLAVLTVTYPLLMAFTPAGIDGGAGARGTEDAVDRQIGWQAFDRAAIAEHVAAGRTVFVDVTADWCVTCQWNKQTVLLRGDVARWLARPDVAAMKADWTRPDPAIADYLAQHGRYGIPFNIVYGPEAPEGVALPELLTADAVLGAVREATGEPALAAAD